MKQRDKGIFQTMPVQTVQTIPHQSPQAFPAHRQLPSSRCSPPRIGQK